MSRFAVSTVTLLCYLLLLPACSEDPATTAAKKAAAEAKPIEEVGKKGAEEAARKSAEATATRPAEATATRPAEVTAIPVATMTDEEEVKGAVLKSLKDPDSAKFGKFTLAASTPLEPEQKEEQLRFACLTVNARNSFGGYTGDQQAAALRMKNTWRVFRVEEMPHQECIHSLQALAKNDSLLKILRSAPNGSPRERNQ